MELKLPSLLPEPDSDSELFWEALQRGTLLYQQCSQCDHRQLYFRAMCRRCWSREIEAVEATGRGMIYSFSVVHRAAHPTLAAEAPFAIGLVNLAEGPRILGRLLGNADTFLVGAQVELSPFNRDGWKLVGFRPVEQHD